MRTNLFVATAFAHNHRRVIAVCAKVCWRQALRRVVYAPCTSGGAHGDVRGRKATTRDQRSQARANTALNYTSNYNFTFILLFYFNSLTLYDCFSCSLWYLRRLPLCLFSSRLPSGRKLQSPYDDCERSQLRQIDLSAWTSELRSSSVFRRNTA